MRSCSFRIVNSELRCPRLRFAHQRPDQQLVLLSNLVYRDRGDMWTRIASAFFDRTGRRIHPLDIKEKLTGETS